RYVLRFVSECPASHKPPASLHHKSLNCANPNLGRREFLAFCFLHIVWVKPVSCAQRATTVDSAHRPWPTWPLARAVGIFSVEQHHPFVLNSLAPPLARPLARSALLGTSGVNHRSLRIDRAPRRCQRSRDERKPRTDISQLELQLHGLRDAPRRRVHQLRVAA